MSELKRQLSQAATKIEIGAIYRHYRAGDYQVLGLGILETDEAVAVRYARADEPGVEFIRALSSWSETVVVDDKIVSRFTKMV